MKKEKTTGAMTALLIMGMFLLKPAFASISYYAFVSFSMPKTLLEETLKDSMRLKIPVYLNGLYQDSMPLTLQKILELTKQIPNLNLQIDPTLFERFGIKQVPALVVEKDKKFDVIYGHLPLAEGLKRIANSGETSLSEEEIRRLAHD